MIGAPDDFFNKMLSAIWIHVAEQREAGLSFLPLHSGPIHILPLVLATKGIKGSSHTHTNSVRLLMQWVEEGVSVEV